MDELCGSTFVYEDIGGDKARGEGQRVDDAFTAEALTALSENVCSKLRQAVESLNVNAANRSIEQIRQQNARLAEALAELVNGYRFDVLQQFLEKGDNSV